MCGKSHKREWLKDKNHVVTLQKIRSIATKELKLFCHGYLKLAYVVLHQFKIKKARLNKGF